jgi:hypothetical protein
MGKHRERVCSPITAAVGQDRDVLLLEAFSMKEPGFKERFVDSDGELTGGTRCRLLTCARNQVT